MQTSQQRRQPSHHLGARVLLGRITIGDPADRAIGAKSLAVLFRWKISNPLPIVATAVIGLIAYPILRPDWAGAKSSTILGYTVVPD